MEEAGYLKAYLKAAYPEAPGQADARSQSTVTHRYSPQQRCQGRARRNWGAIDCAAMGTLGEHKH